MRWEFLFAALLAAAAPAAWAQSPLEELERRLESGRLTPREPGYLGVVADEAGGRGLLVVAVRPGSPAEAAGVRAGDRLVELERRPLRTLDEMAEVLRFRGPGDSVVLTFERDGRRHVVTARLAPREAPEEAAPVEEVVPRREAFAPPLRRPSAKDESLPSAEENVLPPPKEEVVPPIETPPPASPVAPSPREEIAALRREAAALRRRLEQLERRLGELEARTAVDENRE